MLFSEFDLEPVLATSIQKMGYSECTPIQAQAMPQILQGRDIAGLAQTGTGKTAAFVIPLIDRILKSQIKAAEAATSGASSEPELAVETPIVEAAGTESLGSSDVPQTLAHHGRWFKNWKSNQFVMVLVPTRELAEQVQEQIQKLGHDSGMKSFAIYGGTGYDRQKEALRSGLHFIVATPGRLIDLFKEHLIDMKQVRAVVFDEADRMFDMGFKDDMKYILQRIPRDRQFLVFSATLNFDVLNTAYQFGADPVEINVSRDQAKAENVKDEIFHVGNDEKPQHLLSLMKFHKPKQTIVFTNFKNNVERVAQFLVSNGIPASAISSLLTQAQRNRVIEQFKAENDMNVLVATDVAARGLDIKGVDMVINYELPNDSESYVHRIGRTGRAGAEGRAFSLVGDKDVDALTRLEEYLKHKVTVGYLEDKDLLKDFKSMPAESFGSHRFESGDRRPRPPRDGRREGGRQGGRDGGGRNDNRRPQGPRNDRRPEARSGDGSQSREGQRQENRPQQGRGPNRYEGRYEGRREDGRSEGGRSENGTRQGQNRNNNNRNGNGRTDQQRDQRPPRNAGAKPRPSSNFSRSAKPQRPMPPPKGIAAKVSSFFKKLLGS